VHVHPDPCEIGRVYAPELGIVSGMQNFARCLDNIRVSADPRWRQWMAEGRREFEESRTRRNADVVVDLWDVIGTLSETLPEDAIVTNGAGNYAGWLHARYSYRRFGTQLAPANGAMGYGIPAAVAAKHLHPERIVVAVAGDGCFMMSAQELATASHYRLPVIVIVINNGVFGTIRMHQEMHYPGRVSGTSVTNPDFQLFAKSFGAHTEIVEESSQFGPALRRCIDSRRLALVEVVCSPERISANATITELRARPRKAQEVAQ
jgi:acetolactate synthase-1/2/3 large subunit